jgi:hypothetical protein
MKLTVNLQTACVRVLIHCREFKDRHTLEPLFSIEPLTKYPHALPLDVRSQIDLVEIVIHNLVTYSGTRGEAFLDLLNVLRDKREQAQPEWNELDGLCKQVSFYLSSLATEQDPTLPENRNRESETKELREAIQNYHLEADRRHAPELNTEEWLAQVNGNHYEWAFRIALSVFNGAPWDLCVETALDLARRVAALEPPLPEPSNKEPAPPVAPNPLKLLASVQGELVNSGTFRAVRTKQPELARQVLNYVWDEYTRRELLIDWLSDLVVSRNSIKRIRGSIAAGLLMLNNFDSVQRRLLNRWAQGDDPKCRQAIGRALSLVAEEGSLLPEVRRLLRSWACSPEQSRRWAAARAYIFVGARCPIEEVISQWKVIANAEDIGTATITFGSFQWIFVNPLHISLLDAMERFFLSVAEIPEIRNTTFIEGVLGFKRWSDEEQQANSEGDNDSQDNHLTIGLGLLMLIKLARMNLAGEGAESSWTPILLTLFDSENSNSLYTQSLVEIFDQLLLDPASQPTALDLLHNWVSRVEKNPQFEVQMRRFLTNLLERDRLKGQVHQLVAMQLDLWSPRSHFRIESKHPDLSHINNVLLVVDGSESARPYWIEIRSMALELGTAFSDLVLKVYLLSDGEPQTLASLADIKPDLAARSKPACSLIAPILRDVIERQQQIDALILIGNGQVFDVSDWLGHPAINRWVLVRMGPDSLISKSEHRIDELSENLPAAVYDRLLVPTPRAANYSQRVKSAELVSDRWQLDRTGFPIVWIDPLESYLHLFPIAKVQFEQFLSGATATSWSDEQYAELLELNPRASYRAVNETKYERIFLTGIRPEESKEFAGWLGENYSLPDDRQWLACYDWLARQPITGIPAGMSDEAFAIWQIVAGLRGADNLLGLSLMSEGVKEWVRSSSNSEKYAALGCPPASFPTLSRNPRQLVNINTSQARLSAYGFRLLRK